MNHKESYRVKPDEDTEMHREKNKNTITVKEAQSKIKHKKE